jgi:hypothetical protein
VIEGADWDLEIGAMHSSLLQIKPTIAPFDKIKTIKQASNFHSLPMIGLHWLSGCLKLSRLGLSGSWEVR